MVQTVNLFWPEDISATVGWQADSNLWIWSGMQHWSALNVSNAIF